MNYNLKVAKAWGKDRLDKWLEGFEAELRELLRKETYDIQEKTVTEILKEILGE